MKKERGWGEVDEKRERGWGEVDEKREGLGRGE
jgi:hypothetical protein